MGLKDITNRNDIEIVVKSFYKTAMIDEEIGFFFTKIANVNWDTHIPTICDFWETLLFGHMVYKGNPMLKHFALDKKHKMEVRHFDRWIQIWKANIGKLYHGPIAEQAIKKGEQIAILMRHKIGSPLYNA